MKFLFLLLISSAAFSQSFTPIGTLSSGTICTTDRWFSEHSWPPIPYCKIDTIATQKKDSIKICDTIPYRYVESITVYKPKARPWLTFTDTVWVDTTKIICKEIKQK